MKQYIYFVIGLILFSCFVYADIGAIASGGNLFVSGNVSADNVFNAAYIRSPANRTQAVTTGGEWVNITFDKKIDPFKVGFEHTHNDATNTTFTVLNSGYYSISYRASFTDSAANPDAHIAVRLAYTDGTNVKGSYIEVNTHKQGDIQFTENGFITQFDAGDKFTAQFTSDDTTVSLEKHISFDPSGSAAQLNIHRIG